jgi:hypothetical protein
LKSLSGGKDMEVKNRKVRNQKLYTPTDWPKVEP